MRRAEAHAGLYLRRRSRMVQSQPSAEELDGLRGRRAVERHHGAGASRCAGNLRPPLAADRRDFDAVLTAVDGFFEAFDRHGGVSILAA